MSSFKRDSRPSRDGRQGGRSFGGDRDRGFGRKPFGDSQGARHQATCSECGQTCDLPFIPTGDRPVYCSDCFAQQKASNPSRYERDSRPRPDFNDRPRFERRDNRDNGGQRSSGSSNNNELKTQLEQLNNKLDRVLNALLDGKEKKNSVEPKETKIDAEPKKKAEAKAKKTVAKKPAVKKKKTK
ncbi:TPA: hypothetical protein DF272_02895 [Candidatus Falkowbacteria bacterium]|nr:hypothetical protein [Candidatus Falkowbacteria bacterium]